MSVFSKQLVLASTLLLVAFPAFGTDESTETASSVAPLTAGPKAELKCPGGINVPFTFDAEQALPLQLAGSLRCGETVTILSDSEGYTSRVRTQAGVEGYVAHMYLTAETDSSSHTKKRVTTANATNGVARWEAGAPGCDQFTSHDRLVESLTANGLTVQVSIQDTGWKYRVNVTVSNQSQGAADVSPAFIGLDELQPHLKPLPTISPRKLAREAAHQVLWTSVNGEPSPSAVAPQFLAANHADPPLASPDYMNPHMTLASSRPGAFERTESIEVQSIALKTVTLTSGETTAGVMWFERDVNARELSLRVPVGNTVFDFAFAFEPKK
jgi:hypothetical protein